MKRSAFIAITLLAGLTACGGGSSDETTTNTNATTTVRSAGSTTDYRECELPLSNVTTANLSNFFDGKPVKNIEGAVTYCLEVTGSSSWIDGWFRVEYEDDYGIRGYETLPADVYAGSYKVTDTATNIEIIFNDGVGFVQVKGSAPTSTSQFAGTVKYYNFPSYEEALNDALNEAATKCKNGTYTTAQCMGYNFAPTFWWNTTTTLQRQKLYDLATGILNSKGKVLGNISTDLGNILQ